MVTYAVINKQTLHVESTYGEGLKEALLLDFPVENHEHVIIPDGMNRHTLKGEYDNGNYILVNDQEILLSRLRQQRNILLDKSDKYTVPDYPHLTPEAKQAWLDYRQALRDLPANTTDPENPVWPTPPN
jgi:hypothetical protein